MRSKLRVSPLPAAVLWISASLLSGCGGGGKDPVLAEVGDRTLRGSDLSASYLRLKPEDRPDLSTPEAKRGFLQDMINKNLMELAALSLYPEMVEQQQWRFERFRRSQYEQAVSKRLIGDQVVSLPQERDLAWKNMHRDVLLDGIVVPTGEMARTMMDRLQQGSGFDELAAEYSIQESDDPEHPARLGWTVWGTYPWDMEVAAWAAAPGTVVGPFEDLKRGVWYVVRVGESREVPVEGDRQAMDEVLDMRIREPRYLVRQKVVQDSLRAAAGVSYPVTGEVLIQRKFYWEPPEHLKDDPMAYLNDPRQLPALEADEESVIVVAFENIPSWTAAEFLERVSWYPPGLWPRGHSVEQLHDVYDLMVREYLIRKAAVDLGYDKDPEVVAALQRKEMEMRVTYLYQRDVLGDLEISEDERMAWFEENRERYKAAPSYRLTTFTSADRNGIEQLRADWLQGMSFRDLREKHAPRLEDLESVGETAWIHEQNDPPLDDLVAPLDEKGISEIFSRGDRHSVVQLVARRGERLVSYEEAKKYVDEDFLNVARERKLQAFLEAQEAKFGVKVHEDRLAKFDIAAEAPAS